MSEHENCHVEPVVKPVDDLALEKANATYLAVSGMGCPTCAQRVLNGLLLTEGVLLAEVFLEQSMAVAAYDPEMVVPEMLVTAVAGAGNDGRHHYEARILETMPAEKALAPVE
ncbi:MAG: cation transporter [Anaerolineae bacterium]